MARSATAPNPMITTGSIKKCAATFQNEGGTGGAESITVRVVAITSPAWLTTLVICSVTGVATSGESAALMTAPASGGAVAVAAAAAPLTMLDWPSVLPGRSSA